MLSVGQFRVELIIRNQKLPNTGPTSRLISNQDPNIALARPHALGRIPTLRLPSVLGIGPVIPIIARAITTVKPAARIRPSNMNTERIIPKTPVRATAPTP